MHSMRNDPLSFPRRLPSDRPSRRSGVSMSDLFDKVFKLDQGIASRWKAQTSDDPNHPLTAQDIDVIVKPLLNGKRHSVGMKQADAIIEVMQPPRATREGIDRLRGLVEDMERGRLTELEVLMGDELD